MSKALAAGYVGQPPAYMILRELNALKARVAELERHLAVAEQELALREVEGFRTSTTRKRPWPSQGFVNLGASTGGPEPFAQVGAGAPRIVGCPGARGDQGGGQPRVPRSR